MSGPLLTVLRRSLPRHYCLGCYLPLERFSEASRNCPRCGRLNLKADQRIFWTQERGIQRLETLAKSGILVGLALIVWLMLSAPRMQLGLGQGWAVGFPILFTALLWETAAQLTRKKPYFRGTIVWPVIFLVIAVPRSSRSSRAHPGR